MKRYTLKDLNTDGVEHVLEGIVPGRYIAMGGLGFKAPNERTHSHDGPDGSDQHVHDDCEIFMLLGGKAEMEIDGEMHPMKAGDVIVVEPGEDHHLISDVDDPCVNVWMHCADHRNANQTGE